MSRGSYGRSNTFGIAPCRSKATSSMQSAPASLPATNEVTLRPAFAPLSVATDRCVSASVRKPASCASLTSGIGPADDTRFGSSKSAR